MNPVTRKVKLRLVISPSFTAVGQKGAKGDMFGKLHQLCPFSLVPYLSGLFPLFTGLQFTFEDLNVFLEVFYPGLQRNKRDANKMNHITRATSKLVILPSSYQV